MPQNLYNCIVSSFVLKRSRGERERRVTAIEKSVSSWELFIAYIIICNDFKIKRVFLYILSSFTSHQVHDYADVTSWVCEKALRMRKTTNRDSLRQLLLLLFSLSWTSRQISLLLLLLLF